MATKRTTTPPPAPAAPSRPPYMLIEEIRVQGYKSLVDATLHVRPLTLLAGTNSSGKSSIMQPLLLIKQTMEAPYQPAGALVLDGAHVQAETAGELVTKIVRSVFKGFNVSISGREKGNAQVHELLDQALFQLSYKIESATFYLEEQWSEFGKIGKRAIRIRPGYSWLEMREQLALDMLAKVSGKEIVDVNIQESNGFLRLNLTDTEGMHVIQMWPSHSLENSLAGLLHVPGLRINPKRNYIATTFQNQIKGTFDLYAAGTISQWQQQNNTAALAQLNNSLQRLGLTNTVTAKVKNANEVELSVNRLPSASKAKPRKADMVNIADVGIGVSQVLPILVALIAAQEGQIVYVEQPELHLHPRAQVAMGELLAEAANRGVRVIVETHSSLLLLTVQTLVAEGKIKPGDVGLHWFERDAKGATTVRYEQPDEDGAYGEWPEDFGDVELTAQRNYLDAVTRRQPKRAHNA